MKNNLNTSRCVIILFCLIFKISHSDAQNKKLNYGISLGSQITGNSLGLINSTGVYMQISNYSCNIASNFQKNKACGINTTFMATFFSNEESFSGNTSLYVFSSLNYLHKAKLNNSGKALIQRFSPEFKGVDQINYCIGEFYSGAGIKKMLSGKSAIDFNIGIGGFKTLKTQSPSIIPEKYKMVRSDNDLSLFIKINYTFQLSKNAF